MKGVVGDVNDPQFMAKKIQQASKTGNAQVICSGRTSDKEQVTQSNNIAPIHASFAAHGAGLDSLERLHQELSNGWLLGDPRGVAGRREKHVAVHDHSLVFDKHAVGMVFVSVKPVHAHAVGL